MKACAFFSTAKEIAKFMAFPQAVQYHTGDVYMCNDSYYIDFSIEPFMTVEQMKDRVNMFGGTLLITDEKYYE
jgi:hypothetical protein